MSKQSRLSQTVPRGSPWKLLAKSLVTVALFAWLINYANVRFVEVFANLTLASPRAMLLALLLFMFHTALIFLAWHRSLSLFRVDCPIADTAPLFGFSSLTKYVPGGIWHAGSRVWVLGLQGHSRASVLFSVLLESLYSLVASAALVLILFGMANRDFLPDWAQAIPAMLALALGLAMLAMLLIPACYRLVFDWYYARRLGTTEYNRYEIGKLAELVALHTTALLVFVGGYYVTFAAFLASPGYDWVQFAFIVILATFSGFIAIFAPAGLGVRESVLYLLFATLVDSPLLVTLCLAPRLLLLLAEVLFFLASKIMTRSLRPAMGG